MKISSIADENGWSEFWVLAHSTSPPRVQYLVIFVDLALHATFWYNSMTALYPMATQILWKASNGENECGESLSVSHAGCI